MQACRSGFYDPAIGRFITADKLATVKATAFNVTDKNLYSYCDNNPVTRTDDGGAFWDTVFDVVSLCFSVAEVVANPSDPWAWAGLVGDAVDLIPFVSGVGEVTRAVGTGRKVLKAADDLHDAAKVADNVGDVASTAKKGWSLGDDITTLTKAGKDPSWSTVKSRYWKNEALNHASDYTQSNVDRMAKGLAPQVSLNGKMYSMELHHINPRRLGGSNSYDNLLKVTPWKHAEIDPFRHFVP